MLILMKTRPDRRAQPAELPPSASPVRDPSRYTLDINLVPELRSLTHLPAPGDSAPALVA